RLLAGRPPHQLHRVPPARMAGLLSQPPRPASQAVLEPVQLRRRGGGEEVVSPEEVARQRATTPRALAASLAGELDAILAKALETEPERRFASAAELS